jgi:hypothetical protein
MKRTKIESSLVTSRVFHWLHNGRPARILHIFDGVCNLVDDRGDVISLATPAFGPGPFTMVMEGDFHRNLSTIDLQQPVTVGEDGRSLSIGSLIISTDSASVWNATPDWSRLRYEPGINWLASTPLPAAIENQLDLLLQAVNGEDMEAVASSVGALTGLGSGLTPAGDDILLGVIFALWIWFPQQAWIDLIVETAVPHTTTLSAAFLRAAAVGEATVHWHDLVNNHQDAVANILAIGHSSGADAWTGFLRAKENFSIAQIESHDVSPGH